GADRRAGGREAARRRSGRLQRRVRARPRSPPLAGRARVDHAARLRWYGCRAASGRRGVLRQSARVSGRATAHQRDRVGARLLILGHRVAERLTILEAAHSPRQSLAHSLTYVSRVSMRIMGLLWFWDT